MVLISSSRINNKHLFSNYYLENQIDSTTEWRRLDHESAFFEIKKIYDREKAFVGNLSEPQLESRFFRPIFKIILPHYEVQGATRDFSEFPDYAFFPDKVSSDRAQIHKDTASFFKEAYAVGEVKKWDIELDKFGKNRQDKRRNPSFQIWLYLHDTEPMWGILSNGRKWRLYHQERPLDVYYEVDLADMLDNNDQEAFRYFYYFFRKQAFFPNDKGEIFLDVVLKGSEDYAQEIGDNLKENVYRAMKNIAEGFFSWKDNCLDPSNPGHCELVQRNTMILLYRFLFLLYAEGKSLLDLTNIQYRDSYSFDRIKKQVALKVDGPQSGNYQPIKTTLWGELKDLFRLIDQGSEDLSEDLGIEDQIHVPAYNGGLFDTKKHPTLEKWTIGDSFLAGAIDLLSRSGAKNEEKGFVDYSTLEIRHLGSIYEGLLEYKLQIAEHDLVATGGKERKWLPLNEYNQGKKKKATLKDFNQFDHVQNGQLYLTTDNGERKATGSYYTPDYIVNYIVENTVGPIVEARWKDALINNSSLIEAALSVKVLDPAMGSGHFLVGAVDFLAGKLMQAAERDIEWERVEDKGQFTNEWAKREVVSHCVYGVDLNELAVELAKVSLWLTTIAKDKPLSFLDHRLKQGNSLIGAQLSDLKYYPSDKKQAKDQVTLPSFVSPLFIQHLIGKIKELEEIGDDSLSEIKRKEKVFEEFKALSEYTKAKAIANVHTAVYFGNEVEPKKTLSGMKSGDMVYHDLFWAVGGDELEWRRKTRGQWFDCAQKMASERSFFHWELEFPEIFFEKGVVKENPGWDAVVGNPPYVLLQGNELQNPLSRIFPDIFSGSNDISHFFLAKGVQLANLNGYISYIITRYWMEASLSGGLRTFLSTSVKPSLIIDFGNLQVWPEVNVLAIICILRKASVKVQSTEIYLADGGRFSTAVEFFEQEVLDQKYQPILVDTEMFDGNPWYLRSIRHAPIWKKMIRKTIGLGKITKNTQGIKTGNNRAFTVSPSVALEFGLERDALIAVAEAQNVQRYCLNAEQFVIYLDGSSDIEKYPAIRSYLSQFENELSNRAECNQGLYPWWRLQRPRKRQLILNGKRILVPLYSTKNRFYFSQEVVVGMTDIYMLFVTDNEYSGAFLSAILNSKLLNLYHSTFCKVKRAGYLEYSGDKLSNLPIRCISFTTPETERAHLVSKLKDLYAAKNFQEILFCIESYIPKSAEGNLATEQEKSDVVHDYLAYLAEQLLEMNKEKEAEIKDFLRWLERYIGAKVEDLTNKTKLQDYYENDLPKLLDVLEENKRKLSVDPTRRKFLDDLAKEYEESMSRLQPILQRIKETDGLIDKIVYKFYDLTDEEIAMIDQVI